MIYLTPGAQERVIKMFHFALNDGGILFLGMSETTGSQDALFEPMSNKYRVYIRVGHGRQARRRSADCATLFSQWRICPETEPRPRRGR